MEPTIRGYTIDGSQLFQGIEIQRGFPMRKTWLASGSGENGIYYFYDMESLISHYLIDNGDALHAIEYADMTTYVRKEPGSIIEETRAGLLAKAIREEMPNE